MTSWPRMLIGGLFAVFWGGVALAGLTPQAAYLEVGRSGELRGVQIDGDLDLAQLKPPAGITQITLQGIQVQGKVFSSGAGPSVALWIDDATLQAIDLSGSRLANSLTIENSSVNGVARFDAAQFGAPFALHACNFNGKTVFRNANFAAATEIVATQFREQSGLKGGVSFADAHFAGPARFDHSYFSSDVRFDTSRFDADATFLGLVVGGKASWRNVIFGGDAEFRLCRLGEVDFGDAEQMSVFNRMADFRGCTMRALRLDYTEIAGDALLVSLRVSPGDLGLRQTALRGNRSDFSGLQVAGRIDLEGAYIPNLQLQWHDISAALLRSAPGSDVLRPLQRRFDDLKQEDDAREVSALLSDRVLHERLAQLDTPVSDKLVLWAERAIWGWPTGYGTRIGRIVGIALLAWLLLSLPFAFSRRVDIRRLRGDSEPETPRHCPVASKRLSEPTGSRVTRLLRHFAYGFGLMFATPNLRLRPVEPLSAWMQIYFIILRGIGAGLLALMALTLAKVSPIIQAVVGKIV